MTRWRAFAIVLGASVAFATSAPLSKFVGAVDPIVIALVRVAIAAIALAAIDLRGLARAVRSTSRRALYTTGVAGALLGLHFGLFQWGLSRTSLPAAVSLVSLEPLSVVLVAWLLFGVRPRRLEAVGIGVATTGAVLLGTQAGGEAGAHSTFGDVLVLGAVALFGFYVAAAKAVAGAISTLHFAPLVYAGATVTLAAWIAVAPGTALPAAGELDGATLAGLAALGLVPTVIGHTLVQLGARSLRPSVLALVCPGETLGSTLIATVALAIVPTRVEAAGGIIIIVGAVLAALAMRADERPSA